MCHFLALLGAHHILHVSGVRDKCEKAIDKLLSRKVIVVYVQWSILR